MNEKRKLKPGIVAGAVVALVSAFAAPVAAQPPGPSVDANEVLPAELLPPGAITIECEFGEAPCAGIYRVDLVE